MQLKISDIVLCTVKSIEGASVFLQIEDNGVGSMAMSEVAAGRIRNIREYVTPNKKVVCKVLSVDKDHVQLSLRRVMGKEREQALENYKKERNLISIFKTFTKEPEKKIKDIKTKYTVLEFIEESRKNKKMLEEFFTKPEVEKLIPLLEEKETREKEVKKVFTLKSLSSNGIDEIKSILTPESKKADIKYLGSSQFSITVKALDFKEANITLNEITSRINTNAKSKKLAFELK
ncbi:MAG: hypothetical protein Q7R87_00445 [Nanoarchaeota archaeon]|nr:hypothetical protein [Nanoarchaeota archaeon]